MTLASFHTKFNQRQQFIINVSVFPHGSRRRFAHENLNPPAYRAIIDTGANTSAISEKIIGDLGLHSEIEEQIRTASQTQMSPVYSVGIAIPDASPNDIFPLEVTNLPNADSLGVDLLLGMDVLKKFHITIYDEKIVISI